MVGGASPDIATPFKLRQWQCCELVRVALKDGHPFPVTQAVAVALRLLRRDNPGLRIVISFADSTQGHHGGIYQAGNWLYIGARKGYSVMLNGKLVHSTAVKMKYGKEGRRISWLRANVDPQAYEVHPLLHKYVYPLDDEMRRRVESLRCAPPAPVVQRQHDPKPGVDGGSIPTSALQ